jgi:iron complex outermembrane receptor protein
MQDRFRGRLRSRAILVAGGLIGALAGAAPTAGHAAIEEVLVEARGAEESVRDIPVAITALSEETLERYSMTDLSAVAAQTPSLEILRILSGTGTSISIRGISSSAGSLGIEQSVAVIIDGVYFPQGRVINEGLVDVSQVAILKGPQALYFGKNATAGVVSITTNDPGDELEILGRVGYEIEAEELQGQAVLSTPINDKWGIRLAVQGTKMFGGYVTNTAGDTTYTTRDWATGAVTVHQNPAPTAKKAPGEESITSRLTVKATPSDSFTMRLKGSYTDVMLNSPGLYELVECRTLNGQPHRATGAAPNQVPVPAAKGECNKDRRHGYNNEPPTIAAATPGLNRFGGELGESYKSYIISGDMDWDVDWADIRAILNYHRQKNAWVGDNDGGADTSTFAQEFNTFSNYSAELRAATKFDGPINGVAGFYYQQTHRYFEQSVHFAGAENSLAPTGRRYVAYDKVSETDGETVSFYGELKWRILDRLTLTGGARYIWESKDSYFIQGYVNPNFKGLFIENRLLEVDRSDDDIIPEVTLTWQPTDELTVFAAYKQGYKSGGFDNGTIDSTLNVDPYDDITFDPENVEGFEAGVKALLADGTLSLELDAYTYKYNELQLNFFNAPIFAYQTLNGDARSTGAELQASWAPANVEGLTLNGSIAYNDAHYTEFLAPCSGGQSPSEGCTVDLNLPLKKQDLAGKPRNLAPKWAGNLGFDYERPFGNGLVWGLSGNMKWKSKYSLSEFIPGAVQKGYAQLDAAVRIGAADGTWQFAVIGKNLTDQYVLVGVRDAAGTGGNTGLANAFQSDRTGYSLPPRTVKFEFTYRY